MMRVTVYQLEITRFLIPHALRRQVIIASTLALFLCLEIKIIYTKNVGVIPSKIYFECTVAFVAWFL